VAFGIIWIALATARGDLGFGDGVLGLSVVMVLSPRVVPEDIHVAYGAAAVPAILEAERIAHGLAADLPGTAPARGLPQRTITFRNVSFRYPGSDVDVLRGLDLELRAGMRTALVGVNGAGKTTIVKLLCRLYEPTDGVILVDGIPLGDLAGAGWQRQLAVLFQDFVRYELSASENVGLDLDAVDGLLASDRDAGAPVSEAADVVRAAARVGADTVVDGLSDGWATTLSSRYPGGVDLSGGEWQRIAFARALLAVDRGARVLVLDEPTANLDVRAEAALYEQFLELTATSGVDEPLTTVLVSHRLSTVRRADRIVVLDGGVVVEDGTHDALVAARGLYARMFTAQAARFTDNPEGDPEGDTDADASADAPVDTS
jgi:ATP-binding cassette, subfamily B, bacterial